MSTDLLSVTIRTLAFVCLFQAAGAAFFMLLFGVWLSDAEVAIRRIGLWSAISGIALLALHQGLEGARMGDSLSGLFDPHLQALAWHGKGGNAAALQILGLAVIVLGLTARRAATADVASVGAVIATCAALLTGHTSVHPQRPLLATLLAVHLVLVSFWFGALIPLIICTRRESAQASLAVLREFSAVATPLVPCIAIAGLSMALVLMPDRSAWATPYGSLVLVKLAAFLVLMALAAWNRWRGVPGLASADVKRATRALRVSIGTEYLLIVAVLAVTATLTALYSP